MALSSSEVTAAWRQAVVRPGATITYTVQIDVDASTSFKFCTSNVTGLGTDWIPHVAKIGQISGSIHPITREYRAGAIEILFMDSGTGTGGIRDTIKNNRLKGKRVIVKIGEESLGESDYAPFFRGVIDDWAPDHGQIALHTKDAFQLLKDITLPLSVDEQNNLGFINDSPLQYYERILEDANFPADLYDSTSLDPAQYTGSISHWACARSKFLDSSGEISGEVSAFDLTQELNVLLHGGFAPHEDGKLTFTRFDASAAASDGWTADDILEFRQTGATAHQKNRAIIRFLTKKNGDRAVPKMKLMHGNTDAQGNDAYPGESEKHFTEPLTTQWCNAVAYLHTDLTTSATSVVVHGGHLGSFSGATNDGADREPTSTRLVYLLLVQHSTVGSLLPPTTEVLECDGITLDSTVVGLDPSGGSGPGTIVSKATYDITTNGRKYFTGGASTGSAFTANGNPVGGTLVYDITILVDWLKAIIERQSEGVATAQVKTTLAKYATQIGDLVTLDLSGLDDDRVIFIAYNKDGLTGTDKWEVIAKEVHEDTAQCVFTLAKATSTTGYTEEWEPKNGGSIDPEIKTWSRREWSDLFLDGAISTPWVQNENFFDIATGLNLDFTTGMTVPGPPTAPASFTSYAVTASKDTFFRFDALSGMVMAYEVATDASAPALGHYQTHLSRAVAGASAITRIDDMREMGHSMATPGLLGSASNGVMNSNFDHAQNIAASPPAGWRMFAGTWGTDADEDTSTVLTGARSLKLVNNSAEMVSDMIPVEEDVWYEATCLVRASSVAAGQVCDIKIQWYDADKITGSGTNNLHNAVLGAADTWELKTVVAQAPSGARYVRFYLENAGTSDFDMFVDRVSLQEWKPICTMGLSADDTGNVKGSVKIALNQAIEDPGSWSNTGSNRIDIQKDGRYRVSARIHFTSINGGNDGDELAVIIKVNNGTSNFLVQDTWNSAQGAGSVILSGSTVIQLSDGDYVDLWGKVQNDNSWTAEADAASGARTQLEVEYLGPLAS